VTRFRTDYNVPSGDTNFVTQDTIDQKAEIMCRVLGSSGTDSDEGEAEYDAYKERREKIMRKKPLEPFVDNSWDGLDEV
jgi:hypothetical protein